MAATKTTISSVAKWEVLFVDGDTRTITLKNPRNNLALADVTSVMSAYGQYLVGDKNGAAYQSFKDARKVATTTRYYEF